MGDDRFAAMVVVIWIDYKRLRDLSMVFYGATVFMLLAGAACGCASGAAHWAGWEPDKWEKCQGFIVPMEAERPAEVA